MSLGIVSNILSEITAYDDLVIENFNIAIAKQRYSYEYYRTNKTIKTAGYAQIYIIISIYFVVFFCIDA